ncbi:hypothetical protein MPTK1_2g05150 [Marchantia polymorpha subsp. ruderalis]|uniref:Uncharacterized protein n=1 Tax=Marchantia polymorpha TaxID=3197 RepID=A0A2R6X7X6_MARPO|nr:hypothetical protein MARPO_0031s0169 [Marchantia polymorpha]BBN01155.1 hypothetical protein Mp_2g05150 [Marchantia polymorpha subsp. ruderalis]|eukprot:PTQ42206.1 hypothetical protein MARPO_0031s0169 [Marchantia polymorpha]
MIYPLNRSQILRLELDTFVCTLPMSAIATILQGSRKEGSTSAEKIQIDRTTLLEELGKVDQVLLAHLRIGNGRMAVLGRALQEAPFPNLKELHFSGNAMAVESLASLAGALEMGHLSGLKLLDLSNNKIGDEGCKMLCKHLPLNSVQTLLLSDSGIGSSGIEALGEALGKCEVSSGLRSLDLSYNHMDLEGAEVIARCLESGHLATLEILNLSNTALGDGGIKAIGSGFAGGKVPALRELNMSSNLEIEGTEGVMAIGAAFEAKHLNSLAAFYFGGNAIGEKGSLLLAKGFEAHSMPELETLSLWATSMGEDGMKELARLLQQGTFPKVTDINLDGNVVTRKSAEAFVHAFRQNPNLMAKLHMDWPSECFQKRMDLSSRNNITLSLHK